MTAAQQISILHITSHNRKCVKEKKHSSLGVNQFSNNNLLATSQ